MELQKAKECFKRFMDSMSMYSIVINPDNGNVSGDDYINELQISDMKYLCKMVYMDYMRTHQDQLYKDDPVTSLYVETMLDFEHGRNATNQTYDVETLLKKVREFEEYSKHLEQYYEFNILENDKKVIDLKAQLESSANDINFLNKEIECLEDELKFNRQNAKDFDETVNDLVNEIEDLTKQIDEKDLLIKQLKDTSYDSIDDGDDELLKQIATLEDELDSKDDDIDDLMKRNEKLENDMNSMVDKINDLVKQIQTLKNDDSEYHLLKCNLNHKIELLEQEIQSLEDALSSNKVSYNAVDYVLTKTVEENEVWKRKCSQLESEIAHFNDEQLSSKNLNHQLDAAKSRIEVLEQQNELTKIELEQCIANMNLLKLRCDDRESNIHNLKLMLQNADITAQQLSDQVKSLKDELVDAKTNNQRLTDEIKSLEDELNQTLNEFDDTTIIINKLQSAKESLNQQIAIMTNHIDDIETQYKHQSKILSLKTDENMKLHDNFTILNMKYQDLLSSIPPIEKIDSNDVIENYIA